ncbi:MAG: hypothetical protein GX915_02880, partial [Clostridiales bacterium]|nr:hypothetical protein [Clostridiales bacterium]
MSTFGRIISIVLAIILILFIPIQYIAQSQVETMDHIVEAHTHEFTDSVRQKGSITLEDYEEYLSKIDQTKELYNIEIEHATPKTLSDLTLNIQEDTRLVSNGLTIVPDTSKIDSIDAELQSLAAHTHTAACYNGNLHICNGTDCEYDNSSTEILLNTTVKTRSANETKYTQYLIPSKDGGQTWGEHMELGARYGFYPYKYKQEFTYGPDGCYYYLRGDAAASLYKYDPITKISTWVYSFPSNSYPEKIMYRNNLFFVVEHNTKTYSTSYIYTSANGSTWTKGSGFHTQCYIDNIAYGNGIYVAAGYKFNPSPNTINRATVFTSTDG